MLLHFLLLPVLFIIVPEALPREIMSGCPEELFYASNLILVSETLECLKRRLKA